MTSRPRRMPAGLADDRGSALVIVLLATVLLTSLGVGLVLLSTTETTIASNFRAGNDTLYAADAGVERVVQDLLMIQRWNDVLGGAAQSAFIDDSLTPTTPYGERLDLASMTREIQLETDGSDKWGLNNPQWRLFAYGPLADMLHSETLQSSAYIVVWVSDDPSESDNNPAADTNGVLTVLARALGPFGTNRAVEVTVAKTDSKEIERGQIAQRGQEELNQRARKAAVQLPGATVGIADLNIANGGMVNR